MIRLNEKLSACVLMLFSQCVGAVYFNSVIYDLPPDKAFISRPIYNNTDRNNLYTISAYKIGRPGAGDERPVQQSGEVLFSPLSLTVPSKGTDYFRLFYNGPADDRERYYRVTFKEIPVTLVPYKPDNKQLDVVPVVAMSTIFIVRPRNVNLAWQLDERANVLRNTGNTYFRVIIQQGCNGNDEQSTQFYMLPGETYRHQNLTSANKKFIVALDKYHRIGEGCT